MKLTSVWADHVDAHTASGDIAATDLRAIDGALSTADGAVAVTFAANSDANANPHTSDGSIMGAGSGDTGNPRRRGRCGSVLRAGASRSRPTSGSITVSQGATV